MGIRGVEGVRVASGELKGADGVRGVGDEGC